MSFTAKDGQEPEDVASRVLYSCVVRFKIKSTPEEERLHPDEVRRRTQPV
jgi:hypothetical protein